jgi:hypothetical protein
MADPNPFAVCLYTPRPFVVIFIPLLFLDTPSACRRIDDSSARNCDAEEIARSRLEMTVRQGVSCSSLPVPRFPRARFPELLLLFSLFQTLSKALFLAASDPLESAPFEQLALPREIDHRLLFFALVVDTSMIRTLKLTRAARKASHILL